MKTHRHRKQYGGYQREGGWGGSNGKGVKYMVMKEDLTLNDRHTMQFTDHVS